MDFQTARVRSKKTTAAAHVRHAPVRLSSNRRTAWVEHCERRLCLAAAFSTAVSQSVNALADFVDEGDFNGDGTRDLVFSSYSSSEIVVLFGSGSGAFDAPIEIELNMPPDHVVVGDLNGDGRDDLVATSYDDDSVSVVISNANKTFQTAATYNAGTGPRMAALGDFTGDGVLDLAIGKSYSSTLTILRNNGNGTFQSPLNTTVAFSPVDLVTGDFNGDGKIDVAAADYFGDRVAVGLGNGNATFQAFSTFATAAGPSAIDVGDFNNDGKLDLVTANYMANNVSILRGSGNGSFQAATHLAAGSGATDVEVADLDGDGTYDIAVANANADTVSVLFNNTNGTFDSRVNYAVGDSPRSLVIANFNGGGLDIVVANQNSTNASVLLGSGTVVPPSANAGGPYSVNEGGTVQLSALASTGDGLSYQWDLDGDGIYGETGASATRGNETGATPTFSAVGLDGASSRTVSVLVTSSLGSSATDSATVSILNVAPTLTITGNSTVAEGSTYTLSLGSSDPGSDTITSWTINWGNGTSQVVNGNPSSVTKVFSDNGVFTITATATDEDGTYSSNSRSLTVTNVAPQLGVSGAAFATLGQAYTLAMTSTDVGADTIFQWTLNWGDGHVETVSGDPSSATHTYSTSGTYTISATATDEDGTFSAGSKTVVASAAPAAAIGGPYTVSEGGSVTISGTGSSGSGLAYAWDLDGDNQFGETGAGASRGSEVGSSVSFNATALDGPDTRTVWLRVTDSAGRTSSASSTITVANVAPVLTLVGNGGTVVGLSYTLNLSASDQGADTLTSWNISWGDGNSTTVAGSAATATWTFSNAGTYTISATATDEDGTYSANSIALVVSGIPDTTAPIVLPFTLGPFTSSGGSSYSFEVTFDDDVAIDLSTFDSDDILITGPNGFVQYASFVGVVDAGGSARTSTYIVQAPGDTWDWQDNGQYTFELRSTQVGDPSGNFASAAELGALSVSIAPPDAGGDTVIAPRVLRDMRGGEVRVSEDLVGPLDRNDFYRVKLLSRQDLSIKLSNLTDRADLTLMDANGVEISFSRRRGASDEAINRTLQAGVYFIRINYAGSGTYAGYRLRLGSAVPIADPGIGSATNRGVLNRGAVNTAVGALSLASPFKYYRFSLSSASNVLLKLSELADNADLQLLDSAGRVLQTSARGTTTSERIDASLAAGTYFVRVTLIGPSGTSTRLRMENLSR